ncbi:hypothetical protein [Cryptosporangium japonicum]|uniref:Uncharacterized protein n=1 Tax=Cryptosporangium japonicum TaxID=80872 RepID=A0ABN0TLV6_9ACTN
MNDIDTALRTLYTGRADRAPSGQDLLTAVHGRVHRDRRRRLLATIAGVVALALAGGLGAAAVLRPKEARTLQVTDGKVVGPQPAPVRVGRLPAGYGRPVVQYLAPGVWAIESTRTGSSAVLAVQVMRLEPAVRPGPGARRTVRVAGAAGTLYWLPPTGGSSAPEPGNYEPVGPYAELTYQRRPGQWLRIMSVAPTGSRADVERDLLDVAAGITDEVSPVADVIRMTLPDGTAWGRVLAYGDRARVKLVDASAPAGAVSLNDRPDSRGSDQRSRVTVDLVDKDSEEVRTMPLFVGQGRTLASSEIKPEGMVFDLGTSRQFLHLVAGSDRAAVILRVDTGDPLADVGRLRTLAESVRLGVDAPIR